MGKATNKYTANYTLFGSDGRIYKKRIEEFRNSLKDYNDRRMFDSFVEVYKAEIQEKKAKGQRGGFGLTTRSALSRMNDSKLQRGIINSGFSDRELFKETGLDMLEHGEAYDILYNEENWNKSVFTNPLTGLSYEFVFGYTGTLLQRI